MILHRGPALAAASRTAAVAAGRLGRALAIVEFLVVLALVPVATKCWLPFGSILFAEVGDDVYGCLNDV
jgi:hypothetical protein